MQAMLRHGVSGLVVGLVGVSVVRRGCSIEQGELRYSIYNINILKRTVRNRNIEIQHYLFEICGYLLFDIFVIFVVIISHCKYNTAHSDYQD